MASVPRGDQSPGGGPAATESAAGTSVDVDAADGAVSDAFFDQVQPLLASRPQDAADVAQTALDRAIGRRDEAAIVRALLVLGMAHDAMGHIERDAVLGRALQLAEKLAEPVLLLRAVNSQLVVDIYHGRYADALARGQSVLGMAYVLRRDDLLGRLLNNLATALSLIGEFELAIGMFDERLQLLHGNTAETRVHRARAINNQAMAWLGIARLAQFDESGPQAPSAVAALARARSLAETACQQMLAENHLSMRLSSLDTLVSVLLHAGDTESARDWTNRVAAASGHELARGTVHWGTFALVLARVELAQRRSSLEDVLQLLREVESLPGPRFRGGEMQAALNQCLADTLERMGLPAQALKYHRAWLQFEARTQSMLVREHAMAVHHTLDSLRGETEEFITHDLRNPMGAALVQLGPEAVEAAPEDTRRRMLEARRTIQQVFDTADHFLAGVRVRNLRRSELKAIDLAELVDDVGERLAPPAAAAVRLERDIEWGLEIRADRISLLMSLDHLLRGALATAREGAQVYWNLHAEPGHAVLSVQGSGPEWQARVASLRQGAAVQRGRDMGAAMVMRVAQLHDSTLDVMTGGERGPLLEWRFPLVPLAQD
jgi:tetratricopeptide (TPR) repeat protein